MDQLQKSKQFPTVINTDLIFLHYLKISHTVHTGYNIMDIMSGLDVIGGRFVGEVTVGHVMWPRLAVASVVLARPARCSDRVRML